MVSPRALLLPLGLCLALLASRGTAADCLAPMAPALTGFQSALRPELEAFVEASLDGARAVDAELRGSWWGAGHADASLLALRRLNCEEVRGRLAEAFSRPPDADRQRLEKRYLLFRRLACRSAEAKEIHLERLLDSPRGAVEHFLALDELRSALAEAAPSGSLDPWVRARDRLVSKLGHVGAWSLAVAANCPCAVPGEGASSPLSAAQREMLGRMARSVSGLGPSPAASQGLTPADRTRMLAEKTERELKAGRLPAKLRPREELLEATRLAFSRSRSEELDGRLPAGFDWMLTRLELEAHEREPPFTQAQLDGMRARWNEALGRYREIARQPLAARETPFVRLSRVMRDFVQEFFPRYAEKNAGVSAGLAGEGGNCQFATHGVVALLSLIPELIPRGYRLAVQDFENHVQAALVPDDPADHAVIVPIVNARKATREGSLYAPSLALHGTLSDRGIPTGVDGAGELLLRREDGGGAEAGTKTRAKKERGSLFRSTMAHSQSWGGSLARFGDDSRPNPAFALNALPDIGEPTLAAPGAAVPTFVLPGPEASGRPRRALVHELMRKQRAIHAQLLAGQPPLERFLDGPAYKLALNCVTLRRLGEDCESDPSTRAVMNQVDRLARFVIEDPRRAVSLAKGVVAGLARIHEARRAGYPTLSWDPDLSDTGPFTPVYDFLMDLSLVAPAPEGAGARPARVPSRSGTVPAFFGPKFEMEASAYRELAVAYLVRRSGRVSEREEVLRQLIAIAEPRRGRESLEGHALICGDWFLPIASPGTGVSLVEVARQLNPARPRIPCPPGSTAPLMPEAEFERLKEILDARAQAEGGSP